MQHAYIIFQSIVALLHGGFALQSNWVSSTYYKVQERSTSTMKNNDSFVYCNVMGPIQSIVILQVIMIHLTYDIEIPIESDLEFVNCRNVTIVLVCYCLDNLI